MSRDSTISHGFAAFDVEARLLQELGERLVASAEVALLELIKNSSDADASECKVRFVPYRNFDALSIEDDGVGMSEEDFRSRWMRIATSSKKSARTAKFQRAVTGQKGIGRFAIRFLGGALRLTSICENKNGTKTKLQAVFDWQRLDQAATLREAKVAYRVERVPPEHPTGTQLLVWRLKGDIVSAVDKRLLTNVLKVATPTQAFDAGPFEEDFRRNRAGDPGFRVSFEGFRTLPEESLDIAKSVLEHSWARLGIALSGSELIYRVRFEGESKATERKFRYKNSIRQGLHADIAFAPKRKNAFAGANVLRTQIWDWLKSNSGIGVIDNGFRIRPYGFKDDDWLYLNQDGAYNRREWRSSIAAAHFPLGEVEKVKPKLNPTLNLATGLQVLGAVFVASRGTDKPEESDLIPAMDREGFVINDAYLQMVDVVRGGLEFLAKMDKARQLKAEEDAAERARLALRSDLAATAAALQNDPRLAPEERAALAEHYSHLAARVTEQEEYDRRARQRLEIAAGLGVVAGFMTHEAERLFLALDEAMVEIDRIAARDPRLRDVIVRVRESREQLDSYISYTRLYTDSLRATELKPFSALGQIEWIRDNFGSVAQSRDITFEIECDEEILAPAVPVALYSAILLNLFTNAVKAIIARDSDELPAVVLISAWNDNRMHHVTVQDTGVGIREEVRERIWDPFYTTTSRLNSPLGSGMGLGLSLVRDLAAQVDGKVDLGDPSPGYVTCFHVQLPRRA